MNYEPGLERWITRSLCNELDVLIISVAGKSRAGALVFLCAQPQRVTLLVRSRACAR